MTPLLARAALALRPWRWGPGWQAAGAVWLSALLVAVPLCYLACANAYRDARRLAYTRVQAARDNEQQQLLAYYKEQALALGQLGKDPRLRQLLIDLRAYGQRQQASPGAPFPVHGAEYAQFVPRAQPLAAALHTYGWRDVFLIDAQTGQVLITAMNESDNGQVLGSVQQAGSGLGACWRGLRDYRNEDSSPRVDAGLYISDIVDYPPGGEAYPNQFLALPLYYTNPPGAVLVAQLELHNVERILRYGRGLGHSGQSYLAGPDRVLRNYTRRRYLDGLYGRDGSGGETARQAEAPALPVERALNGSGEYYMEDELRGVLPGPGLGGAGAYLAYTRLFPAQLYYWYGPSISAIQEYDGFWFNPHNHTTPELALIVELSAAEACAPARRQSALYIALTLALLYGALRLGLVLAVANVNYIPISNSINI